MAEVWASELFESVKKSLRITNTAYDTEISDLILAAKSDLALSGLLVISETDAIIKRAITIYCKANFGWGNPEAEKLQQSYEMLRNHLCQSIDYAYFTVTFTVKNSLAVAIDEVTVTFNGETKLTNSLGIAIFYVREGNNYEYTITHEDYQDYLDEDGEPYLVDISASTTINITMTGV
jgi:hypothetical protein